ncbi:MAG: hypothetical protein RL367_1364 [Pseudomonadota bacterium]
MTLALSWSGILLQKAMKKPKAGFTRLFGKSGQRLSSFRYGGGMNSNFLQMTGPGDARVPRVMAQKHRSQNWLPSLESTTC